MNVSLLPDWIQALPLQQQAVLVQATRGADGFEKWHDAKHLVRCMRAIVFKAAYFGRTLEWGEKGDSYMDTVTMSVAVQWENAVQLWFDVIDQLPLHYVLHFAHAAEIIGYSHPDERYRELWLNFYLHVVNAFHMNPETEEQMNQRLADWNRKHWDEGPEDHGKLEKHL